MRIVQFSSYLVLAVSALFLASCGETVDGMVDDVNRGVEEFRTEARGYRGSEKYLASPCPRVEIVEDLSMLSDFIVENKQLLENLIAELNIRYDKSDCELARNSATVDLKITFFGKLGPRARKKKTDKPFLTYPFFVAVVGPNGKIMAKEVFAMSMNFEPGQTKRKHEENLRQIIPIKNKDIAYRYRVLVGFQLTPEQLAYNRSILAPKNVPIPKRKPDITAEELL